jgi:hypothetical protein
VQIEGGYTDLEKRAGLPLSVDRIPNIGDFIVLAGLPVQLVLSSIDADAAPNQLDRSLAMNLLPQISNAVGNIGHMAGGAMMQTGAAVPQTFFVDFDAGENQGAGAIDPAQWTTIVGALINSLTQ